MTDTIWNSANWSDDGNGVLTNGGKTLTNTGSGETDASGTTFKSSGKWAIEFDANYFVGGDSVWCGLTTPAPAWGTGVVLSLYGGQWHFFSNAGGTESFSANAMPSSSEIGTVRIELDLDTLTYSFFYNDTLIRSLSSFPGIPPCYPLGISANSQSITLRTSGLTGTLTSGFTEWDAVPPTPDWAIVGQGTLVTATSGNLILVEPAGVAQDDVLVADIDVRSNAAFTLPSGWNFCSTQQSSGNTTVNATGSIASGLQAYCIRGASAPGLTFTRTGGDLAFGRIRAYRCGTPGTPSFDGGSSNTLTTASATVTTAGITTIGAKELLVAALFGASSVTASNCNAATAPTGNSGATDTTSNPSATSWTERQDSGTTSGADGALATFDAIKATAGATGTITVTASASRRHAMALAAFIPPSSGSTYNDTAAISATSGFSSSSLKVSAPAASFAATLGFTPSSFLSGVSAVALAATTSQVITGRLGITGAIALAAVVANALSAQMQGRGATTLSATAGLSPSNSVSISSTAALAATLAQTGSASLAGAVAVALDVNGGLGASASETLSSAAAIASLVGLAAEGSVASSTYDVSAAMAVSAVLSSFGARSMSASEVLAASSSIQAVGNTVGEAATSLAVTAGEVAAANLALVSALSLSTTVGYSAQDQLLASGSALIDAGAFVSGSVQSVIGGDVSFSAVFDHEASATIDAQTGADLSASLAVIALAVLASEERPPVFLQGSRSVTINLEGRTFRSEDLAGTVEITIHLNGKLN